jgi:hypothetical protein
MMSDVYRNSFVTISANIRKVAGTGCFVERNPLESRPCRLGVSRYAGTDLLDRLGPCPAVEDPLAKPVFACIIEPFRSRGPLGNRAWVLQERLLSPRTLEFTRHGLRWQCDSSEASEMRPLERPVGGSSYNWNPIVHKIEPGSEYGSWYSLIGTYNRKSITYPTDKLPALAGLAKSFQERMKDEYSEDTLEYVAGLWSRDLAPGLLWRARHSSRSYRSKPPLKYIAPSWSWASLMYATIDFRISSIETSEIESFQIIETQCNLEGANEFGQVTDGALLVSGQLRDDVGLDPFDDGLERNVLLAWPPHDCIGKVFLDEPVEPGARLWCLPILVKTIYPSSLGGDIKGYDGRLTSGRICIRSMEKTRLISLA